jgi:hypothetical protein
MTLSRNSMNATWWAYLTAGSAVMDRLMCFANGALA